MAFPTLYSLIIHTAYVYKYLFMWFVISARCKVCRVQTSLLKVQLTPLWFICISFFFSYFCWSNYKYKCTSKTSTSNHSTSRHY